MRFQKCLVAAAMLGALCLAPIASAQSNPIVQHYRAYVAALERGDLDTAVSEAQAAVAASEARDGDGGRTAVLLLNLSTVQLQAGRPEQARQNAQRALDLARAGAEGMNPTLAELVIARATLATSGDTEAGAAAAANLLALLNDSPAGALSDQDFYWAGAELGNWGLAHNDYELGRSGWAFAGAHAAGSPFGEVYGLGRARTNEGVAIVLGELSRADGGRIDEDEGHEAYALLSEGARVLHPLSQIEAPTLQLTLGQQTYAEARAWMLALGAKLAVDGHDVPEAPAEAQGDADGLSEIGPVDITRPRCMMRVVARPPPRYPNYRQVAAVVLFFRIGADGQILAHQVAARAGSPEFADAIERVVGRWRVERMDDSPPNCRMEASLLQTVSFRIGSPE